MFPVRLIVAGCGDRGTTYSQYAAEIPDKAKVVGAADPRELHRNRMARTHGVPTENVFADWQAMADRRKFADAVIIATQDADHVEPAIAFAEKGYAILLEKPMAPNEPDCRRIVEAAVRNDTLLAVCHVMRYTAYTRQLKVIIDSGQIGDIVSIQHLEPVGYWHHADSFVRGAWRNEAESSNMLLAKSCHDLDWLLYIAGEPCAKVSSFGGLYHFRPENHPPGAADRCLDCSVEPQCPYSAKKIYLSRVERGETGWPVNVLASDLTVEGVTEALRSGPYGRCVYRCDNDVVDHQVVNMEFLSGRTASFTMTGFTEPADRKTRIFGTRGEINGDGRTIRVFDFLTDRQTVVDTRSSDVPILTGHAEGDFGLMDSFVAAVAEGDRTKILSGPQETLESHRVVFAAERARRENQVVQLSAAPENPRRKER